jgi:glycosyltransferase involved in cell wall biosynthesis
MNVSQLRTVHVVVPEGIDDPMRPSGGNSYDRRVCDGLVAAGWQAIEYPVPGDWPQPDTAAEHALAQEIARVPDNSVLLVDGLIASAAPGVLVPQARRVRLVVLLHMPLEDAGERAVLRAARAVITTSAWTRQRLVERHAAAPDAVHIAEPGVAAAELAPGSSAGGALLCVAAVVPAKGHDVLLAALADLADLADLPWHCVFVGTLDRDPEFVATLRSRVAADRLEDRVCFAGPRVDGSLDAAYAAADALVLASHTETYAMVVTEALARGLPVIATAVGGVPDTLGHASDGARPGLLVPPGDQRALTAGLRNWLSDAAVRDTMRRAARERRVSLSDWSCTTDRVARVLSQVSS